MLTYLFQTAHHRRRINDATPPLLPKDSADYQLIHQVFVNMGAKMHQKKLQVVLTTEEQEETAIMESSGLPFHATYHLTISLPMIQCLADQSDQRLSREDIIQAITAHEATHLMEDHAFITANAAVLMSVSFFTLIKSFPAPILLSILLSVIVNKAMYAAISQQLEYRADKQAHQQGHEVSQSLIQILTLMSKQPHSSDPFFASHPSHEKRIENLKKP